MACSLFFLFEEQGFSRVSAGVIPPPEQVTVKYIILRIIAFIYLKELSGDKEAVVRLLYKRSRVPAFVPM